MATLKDVAQAASVSPSTASGALRGKSFVKPDTAEHVRAVAEQLNYTVNVSARALRSGQSDIFTMMIPDMTNPFYTKLANALAVELMSRGQRLIVQFTQYTAEEELTQLRALQSSMSDGLFMCTVSISGKGVHDTGIDQPVIMFDDMSNAAEAYYDSIETPSQAGMEAIIRHLAMDCKRRRIAIVGAYNNTPEDPTLAETLRKDRYDFAYQALQTYGLADENSLIPSDWGIQAGIEVAHQLVRDGLKHDALCCMNDELALGVIRGLHECGIDVPGQVAVTGFDGIDVGSYATPTLTTIAVDFAGMAQTAADMMMQQVKRRRAHSVVSMPRRVIIGFQLLKRESTLGLSKVQN